MAVYVDRLKDYPNMDKALAQRYGTRWCHMYADTDEELHKTARRMGLQQVWFQHHSTLNHYDITPRMRAFAIKFCGVVEDNDHHKMRQMIADRLIIHRALLGEDREDGS